MLIRGLLRARHISTCQSTSNLVTRLQETVDRWPTDSSKGFRDVRLHLQNRSRQLISAIQQNPEQNAPLVEAEIKSLLRLITNANRDQYSVPSGLGASQQSKGAPIIAATGLSLAQISKILTTAGNEPPKRSLWSRLLRLLS